MTHLGPWTSNVLWLIQAYKLVLREVRPGCWLLAQSRNADGIPDLDQQVGDYREHIVAELHRRVVALEPNRAAQWDLDPWRHAENGMLRMLAAGTKLEQWRAERRTPQVRWVPTVAIVDGKTGEPLAPPSWMLPELLWLLRDRDDFKAAYVSIPQTSGLRLA